MPEKNLDFVKEAPLMLALLRRSQAAATCVAIKSPRLGSHIVVTAVEAVVEEKGRHKVILKHYDASGYILPSNKLYLDEILAVCAFSTPFRNPIKDQLEKDRRWHF